MVVRIPRSGRPRHPGGVTRVLSSDDGSDWSSEAVVSEEGVDLRDSKLTITPDGRLMLLMGGSVYDEKGKFPTRAPRGSSRPPYRESSFDELSTTIGGPNFIRPRMAV